MTKRLATRDTGLPLSTPGLPLDGTGFPPPDMCLPQVLARRAARTPDRRAYLFLGGRGEEEAVLTDGELHRRACRTAARLAARCVPGERVLLLFPPGLDFIVGFFACLYAGLIAVPVNPPQHGRLAAAARGIVGDCGPAAVLGTAGMLAEGRAVLPGPGEPGAPAHWLPVGGLDDGDHDGGERGDAGSPEVSAEALVAFTPREPDPGSVAFLQYTSGSTSAPKGVMVTHGNLIANERMIAAAFGHDRDSTIVGWAPFFHDQGLIGNVLQPLYTGASCVLMSPMTFLRRPLRWLEAISRHRAHTSGGPNFAFDACVAQAARGGVAGLGLDLSCWKAAFNGAEPIRPATLRRFAEAFAPCGFAAEALFPCYGLAEATLMVTGSGKGRGPTTVRADADELGRGRYTAAAPVAASAAAPVAASAPAATASAAAPAAPAAASAATTAPATVPGEGRELAGSGVVLPGQDVRVVDPGTGLPSGPDQIGEIWVAGPHVARGYWRREDATTATFRAQLPGEPGRHYLRTGDLGFLAGRELYVTGRCKDLIIIRGRNYYPHDIEDTVCGAHRALRPGGCAAFSVATATGEERLVAVAEVRPGDAARDGAGGIAGDIRAAVIRDHQITLSDLVLVRPGQVEKTSSGKVRRSAARERYLAAEFRLWPPSAAVAATGPQPPATATASSLSSCECSTIR